MTKRTILAAVFGLLSSVPGSASAVLMNVDFDARFLTIHADTGGWVPPAQTVSGRMTLDYDTVDDIGGNVSTARYTGGVVGGAWSAGAYSWNFVDGPENRFYVVNDQPGRFGPPYLDGFAIYSNFVGSAYAGLAFNFFELNLSAYPPFNVGLTSTQPPMSLDLNDFTGPNSSRRIMLAFLDGPRSNVFVEYELTRLALTPVASVPEPVGLGFAALGLLALVRRFRRAANPG